MKRAESGIALLEILLISQMSRKGFGDLQRSLDSTLKTVGAKNKTLATEVSREWKKVNCDPHKERKGNEDSLSGEGMGILLD